MARFNNLPRREQSGPLFGGLFLALIFLIVLGAAGPWHLRMGFIATALGLLMLKAPAVVRPGKTVLLLSAAFLLFGLAPFLPVDLFGIPGWRQELNELGVGTGDLVAIQWRQALAQHLSLVLLFLCGLWVLGQRFSPKTSRNLALAFVFSVAAYALIAKLFENQIPVNHSGQNFGFFPNRNHNSNLLSLGFICGLGALFQAVRSKHYAHLALLVLASGIILWAILSWNLSRSGIVLCATGTVIWLLLLGRRYFGRQERKVLGLVALLIVGVYGIAEFAVKDRIDETVEKISGEGEEGLADSLTGEDPSPEVKMVDLDFRVPVHLDTFTMIADAPLTGVGAGQFRWVFPQYREKSIGRSHAVAVHPESSWLFLAAEQGLPAALCLLALVFFLFLKGIATIRKRKQRDRALRLGCLVAAALVPLHSLFDVPAHRPSLYLASLFLYVLSQQAAEDDAERKTISRWPSLILALALLGVGVRVLGISLFGWSAPAMVQSEEELAEGAAMYQKVADLQNPLPPFESLKLRKEISEFVKGAAERAPLDGRLYRLSGLATLPLQFESEETARNFAIDRQLTPFSVKIPLLQASAALFYNQEEVEKGWLAALARAKAVDAVRIKGAVETERVLRDVKKSAARNSQLKPLAARIEEEAK